SRDEVASDQGGHSLGSDIIEKIVARRTAKEFNRGLETRVPPAASERRLGALPRRANEVVPTAVHGPVGVLRDERDQASRFVLLRPPTGEVHNGRRLFDRLQRLIREGRVERECNLLSEVHS